MMHPDTELTAIGPDVGLGVVATAPIPAGTLVWVRDRLDRSVPAAQITALPQALRDALRTHAWWQGTRCYLTWDHGRYTNHSCSPNCAGFGGEFDVAIRDIAAGEQITNDYAHIAVDVRFQCRCGSVACRGWIGPGDPGPSPLMRAAYERALDRLVDVDQPLGFLLQGRGVGFGNLRRRLGGPASVGPSVEA